MSKERRNPVREIKFGSVRASISRIDPAEGEEPHRVTFRCHYKERGAWRDDTTFGLEELPLLARAAELALAWIYSQPRKKVSANDS